MQSKPVLTSAQQRWVDALRSGKYKQGRRYLCFEGKYCCLGVACDVLKEELDLSVTKDDVLYTGTVRYNGGLHTVPIQVVEHLNLYGDTGWSPRAKQLTVMNDEDGKTFEEIADAIETGAYFRSTEVG